MSAACAAGAAAKLGPLSIIKLPREHLLGRWRNAQRKTEFFLRDDGFAQSTFGDSEQYPGTWHFSSPRQISIRAVIPLNDPEIVDELNAHEMCYEIRTFTGDKFTAEEFDWEGIQEFTRQ